MGSCLSKKSICASSSSPVALPDPPGKPKPESQLDKKKPEEETLVKKEIFIIKHRRSHEVDRQKPNDDKNESHEIVEKAKTAISAPGSDTGLGNGTVTMAGAPVRTSSCTKEEVDAILIQCGRLSRSSSTGKPALSSEGRKYSGSKRSFDFDNDNGNNSDKVVDGEEDDSVARERENRRRDRRSPSHGRRRTPSREREREQQRSGSRERNGSGSGGGRRVSRSPGRRSESPITSGGGGGGNSNTGNSRPGKMVSVPATVTSSMAMDKSTNGGETVKRIQVKRNVGGDGRTGASPRARSPARVRGSNENGNGSEKPLSLSRSNSRKAESSPYRRNPLAEIDTNIISQAPPMQKPNTDNKTALVTENRITSNNLSNANCRNNQEPQKTPAEETNKGLPYGMTAGHIALNVIPSSAPDNLKTTNGAVTRSRSSRLSRDLDSMLNPENPSNPNASSSYTALLLEDIQNFHQKNTSPPPFTLPPCVTKACSILEAVADLNSSTGSNLSTTFSGNQQMKEKPSSNPVVRKTKQEMRDPILESEVVGNDDLMEPSFHKYVTVKRGTAGGDNDDYLLDEEESSGSNSFVAGQQQWVSSSVWEPNSAESTDRCTKSNSSSLRLGSKQNESVKRLSAVKKKDSSDHQQNGIGRGRNGTQSSHATVVAASS